MFRCLSPGAIGIKGLSLDEQITLARNAGFQGLDVPGQDVSRAVAETSAGAVADRFREAGLRPGSWSPGDWRTDEGLEKALADLPAVAQACASIGAHRATTWIMSSSDRPYKEAWQWHADRLRPVARILADNGCRFGLEYVGPQHLQSRFPHPFLHTSAETLKLAADIGTGNVGLLFDAYHWYTAGETLETIAGFAPSDIVSVHVNDAPSGVPLDEQQDGVRCMPGETGVIDIAGFLKGLVRLGYDGPVVVEPFKGAPQGVEPREAARLTNESLLRIWKLAGL